MTRGGERRVLLMYITRVSGHRKATVAIQRTLHQLSKDIEAPCINGFGYTYPLLEKVVNRAYLSVIKRTPKVWDVLYDNPRIVKKSRPLKEFLHKTSQKKLQRLFQRHRPDTVVCTQAFPCGMVADYKRSRGLPVTLIGVLTDFMPHSFWLNEGVDYYVVPTLEARDRFLQKGVPPDAIKVYGIPIDPKFSKQLDKGPIMARMGLDPDVPVVLIMGGGQGLGPIRNIVSSLERVGTPLQMVVVSGTNKKLVKWLSGRVPQARRKIVFYEYATNVDELMEIASLIVTKPGGMTTSEALAKGLPMVVVNPIPGQESRNTDFLLEKGIALRIDKTKDIAEEIEWLLRSPNRLAAMSRAAYAHARPHAALDIGRLILESGPAATGSS